MERLFIDEYMKNGHDATKAYLAVRPSMDKRSASVCADNLLKKPEVIHSLIKKALS